MHSQTNPLPIEEAIKQVKQFALFGAIRILLTDVGDNLWVVEAWGP